MIRVESLRATRTQKERFPGFESDSRGRIVERNVK